MKIKIGDKYVGEDSPTFAIAEIGINHNGDIELAKKLIDVAVDAGCDAVKFQKRTIDVVYTSKELAMPRPNNFGETNGDLKRGLEFGQKEYLQIQKYCKEKNIMWFASCWDKDSVDFINQFDPPCFKIASACLTDDELLEYTAKKGKPIILSTGMSTLREIDFAVKFLENFTSEIIILHCTATYPSKIEELNLLVIEKYKDFYRYPIGYSGHEVGVSTSIMAVTLGACVIERHITLDRAMWGSDQAASLEPHGIKVLVRDVKEMPAVLGDGKKKVYDSEIPIKNKLRRIQ